MPSFLLTWNPRKWSWPERQNDIRNVAVYGRTPSRWNIHAHRQVQLGDTVYLMRVGLDAGIVASGVVTSAPFEEGPWERPGSHKQWYVDVYWNAIPSDTEGILSRTELAGREFNGMNWSPRRSGEPIPNKIAASLERYWLRFLEKRSSAASKTSHTDKQIAEELGPKGRRLLRAIVAEIHRGRIQPRRPDSFLGYGEALELMGFPSWPYAGRRLIKEGLKELNRWTVTQFFIPRITGLIVNQTTKLPGDGFTSPYGHSKNWKSWWLHESARAVRFNWLPYLKGSEAERGPLANDIPEDLQTKRKTTEINRIIRDTKIIRDLKRCYKNQCQICGLRLKLGPAEYYSEGHHLRPLGDPHKGDDAPHNVICVCPNCHAKLDRNAIRIQPKTIKILMHDVSQMCIDYHNAQCRS